MKIGQWKKRMMTACFVLMPVGLLLIVVGAANSWGSRPLTGFAIGSVGLFVIVVGALCGKFAIAGPFPRSLEADA